jgi:Type I phosphodiesterase / nucleotide pyrophosphatase
MKKILILLIAAAWPVSSTFSPAQGRPVGGRPRNIVIVVFDGLRSGSVNATDTPTMDWIRTHGVSFENSHSLFPTFTTANASAIATGHYLGDTGDFSNTFYIGQPIFLSGNFGRTPGTYSPYIENNSVLGDLDATFNGNYLSEETLLSAARAQGFNTAAVGKMGPTAIQDVSQLNPVGGKFAIPRTVILDDGTGTADGVPLSPQVSSDLVTAGLPTATPTRKQATGNNTTPGTTSPNTEQQGYFANAVSRVILPMFKRSGKPFVLLYWSRDPDGTQHFQGDSLNKLVPGINGPTSRAALRNADDNLKQILDYINGDPDMAANTDIFLTADHGFATISKHDIDAAGHATASFSAKWVYKDAQGRQDVNDGFLPPGFLAIDIAHELGLPLFDPDVQINGPDGKKTFLPVDPKIPQQQATVGQHPVAGNGLIGGTGRIANQTDAKVVISSNGGSDLIYLPVHDPILMEKIVAFLTQQDYVGGLFADDAYGKVAGALPLSAIRLAGSSKLPRPSIVVAFKTFATDSKQPLMNAIQITDTNLQQGQGMHGSFGRGNTFNFMAAIGPDFKTQFVDPAPISNADIQPTLAKILGFRIASNGKLNGRILDEALRGGPASVPYVSRLESAQPAANGKTTVLMYQQVAKQVYFDSACFQDEGMSKQVMCP